MNNIGSVYSNRGDLVQALDFYQQALCILREVGDPAGEATTLNNIGAMHQNRGDLEQALEFHQQAVTIRRLLPAGRDHSPAGRRRDRRSGDPLQRRHAPPSGLYRLRRLHRAIRRAGLRGIGRADGQGSFIDAVG